MSTLRRLLGGILSLVGFVGFWIGGYLGWGACAGSAPSTGDWSGEERIAAAIAAAVLVPLMGASWALGRRLSQLTAAERLAEDPRAPVLLLRSFSRDGARVDVPLAKSFVRGMTPDRHGMGLEEILVDLLEAVGPVVAIGRPGESLAPLGAGRWYAGDEWKREVAAMAGRASLIALIADASPGVRWELTELLRACPGKLLVLLPPADGYLRKPPDRDAWTALRAAFPSLPEHDHRLVGVAFDDRGAPRPIVAREALLDSHLDALRAHIAERARALQPAPVVVRGLPQDEKGLVTCPKCAQPNMGHFRACAWCNAPLVGEP